MSSTPTYSQVPIRVRSTFYRLSAMRAVDMRVGAEYEMQRGPSRRPRRVTLLDTAAPSGRSHWVLVRFENGISTGQAKEVSSQSLYPLPGSSPSEEPPRAMRKQQRPVPPDWQPRKGESVAWTQTLGSRCTVLSVDPDRGIAQIEGVVLGMTERFDAPVAELSPYEVPNLTVLDGEVEERLGDRLPEVQTHRMPSKQKAPRVEPAGQDEDVVDRLVFSPNCIKFYRQRFAKGCDARRAEELLRSELHKAKLLRKYPGREYLRLRVQRRFDVVLVKPPIQGDFESCYIRRLHLPVRSQRSRRAA